MAKEHGYCIVSVAPVRAENKDQSEIVTQLLFGETVQLIDSDGSWVKISTLSDSYEGWIDHKQIKSLTDKELRRWLEGLTYTKRRISVLNTPWGRQWIHRGSYAPEGLVDFNIGKDQFRWEDGPETLDLSLIEIAKDYLNTPYLWGGKTPSGIDCSGFTQIVFRLFDYNLPRDASQQVELGAEIEFDDIAQGDLAFFSNSKGRITHVGIALDDNKIIHASGHVRIDQLSPKGIVHSESGNLTHNLTIVKRM